MKHLKRILNLLAVRLPRLCCFALLLVLPFGYYPDYPDSSQFEIGVGGGYGQAASIVRSCDGGIRQQESNQFTDFAVTGYGRTKLSERSDAIYGAQFGYFRSTARFADLNPTYSGAHADRWYFGPRFAIETRYVGFGLGFLINHVPYRFEYDSDWDNQRVGPSFHLRLGSLRGLYFMGTLDENSPVIAGGGHVDLGLGFPIGGKVRVFSAVSALPYDQLGYLQHLDISLSKKMALNLAMRAGEAGDTFEGAFAATLVFRLGSVKVSGNENSTGL